MVSIATSLQLKSFRAYIVNLIETCYVNPAKEIDETLLQILNVAYEEDLHYMAEKIMSKEVYLKNFTCLDSSYYQALPKEIRFELLKRAFLHSFKYLKDCLEVQTIFLLFEMAMFQDICVTDKGPKNIKLLRNSDNLESLSCEKGSEDCATLVVEEKEIHVNSFILTSNSPVFKAMLQSNSFKEGQNRRIELPGKKFNEVVYFLQFLRSLW